MASESQPAHREMVLLVEDHADTRHMYAEIIKFFGYSVSEACDGFEGWAKATALRPDVIVTDIGLPKMDGIELCARLKANDLTAHIPVIALTGFGEPAVSDRAQSLGIVKVLVKPCSPDHLIAEITRACASKSHTTPCEDDTCLGS